MEDNEINLNFKQFPPPVIQVEGDGVGQLPTLVDFRIRCHYTGEWIDETG